MRRLGLGPVKDLGLLDAAIARPKSSVFGEDAYPTVRLKAAALLHSIVTNHAWTDGNKRLGWRATTVFLDVTSEPIDLGDDVAFRLVLDVVEGRIGVEALPKASSRPRTPGESHQADTLK